MSVMQVMKKGLLVGGRPARVTKRDNDFGRVIPDDAPLAHYVNWEWFDGIAPLNFRTSNPVRRSLQAGATISPVKISADPVFNGLPSADFSGIATSTDLRIKGSKQSLSFTWIFIVTRGAVPKLGNICAMSITDSVYPQNIAITNAGNLQVSNTGSGAGNFHIVPYADLPPIDQAQLLGWCYNDVTRKSAIYVNQGVTPHSIMTMPQNAKVAPGAEICIGGAGQPTSQAIGWDGKIAHVSLMFSDAINDTDPRLLANVMGMGRQHLGMA